MRSWMGNLKTMRYLIMLFWDGWHIYFMYFVYILCIAHPFVCVWRWSDDSLSGSRWFDMWARRCI